MVSSEETFCIPENGAYTEKTTSPAVEEQIVYAEGETFASEDVQPEENEFTDVPWYCYSQLIYHACGIVDGVAYTNSQEAMEATLSQGNRLIEVDFLFTEDGHLICGHKWKDIIPVEEEEDTNKKKKKPKVEIPEIKCDLDTFLTLKIKEKYTGLTGRNVIEYMEKYPDLYVVLDTKEEDSKLVVSELLRLCDYRPDIADRFVIQLFDSGLKEKMLELYPFPDDNFLFTCYKFDPLRVPEILEICRNEQIDVVTVPYGRWEQETIDLFLAEGIILFEHTVNLTEEMVLSLQKGIYGFYTDSVQQWELQAISAGYDI